MKLLGKVNRRISAAAFALVWVGLCTLHSMSVMAQTPPSGAPPPQSGAAQTPQPAPDADDNPTRAVFFSIREEYRDLLNGAWANRLIMRKYKAVLKGSRIGGRTGFLLRSEVPIVTTNVGSETHTGLGDIYGQVLYVPYLTRKFGFVAGTGLVFPTATHRTLGFGKWQVAPLAVPVWFLPRGKGFFLVRFQNYISFAGAGSRPGVNVLFVNPTLNYVPVRRWLVQAEVESRTNWKNNNRTDYRLGFGVGRVMHRRLFLGIKPEIPIGGNRSGDWNLKLVSIFYGK